MQLDVERSFRKCKEKVQKNKEIEKKIRRISEKSLKCNLQSQISEKAFYSKERKRKSKKNFL